MSENPTLPEHHPNTDSTRSVLTALYNWNYEPEIDQLRTLYANALERQWIAMRDLDWQSDIDREAFTKTFSMGGIPISETRFWKSLSLDTRWNVARTSAAFMLSNFLHGEQGALMVAAQLVNAVPHMDGKFYAATQTLDEARHVEAFAAYINKLQEVHEISPGLKDLLDSVLGTEDWMKKAVGMQVVTEGLALYFFRDMRNQTEEPLLKKMLTYVSRDEARHTGYGIKYLAHVVPTLGERERQELEDFAFEATRMLMASRAGNTMRDRVMEVWAGAGVDPTEAMLELAKERDVIRDQLARTGGRYGPVSGFVIPTLRSVGLYGDRIAASFKDMWTVTQGAEAAERYANSDAEIPEDLEAWVNEGYESL
ncbi:MAG: ferritin-like domain-containing protein [Deltaproteobacteria bacterium]|nr:ferritin-like domain-containing protein [Deltaproteobacteria bacterium]MBW2447653.1 ferritin-like domain-containing protein [Deltaproteobacteria bacterium]